jgi:phage terminase small subunit
MPPERRGAARKDPAPALPDPPESLSDEAREVWDRLAPHVPAGRLHDGTADMFAMLCTTIATWHEANGLVNDSGILTVAGQDLIPSPALAIRVQADAMTARWAKMFGLTPDTPATAAPRAGVRHLREA